MKISLGTDHAGFHYKEKVKALLAELGHEVKDFGTFSEEPVDYPRFIRPAAEAVVKGECDRAIVFGGSGNGEAIAANIRERLAREVKGPVELMIIEDGNHVANNRAYRWRPYGADWLARQLYR